MKIKCKGCDRVHDISFADEGHDEVNTSLHPLPHPSILSPRFVPMFLSPSQRPQVLML